MVNFGYRSTYQRTGWRVTTSRLIMSTPRFLFNSIQKWSSAEMFNWEKSKRYWFNFSQNILAILTNMVLQSPSPKSQYHNYLLPSLGFCIFQQVNNCCAGRLMVKNNIFSLFACGTQVLKQSFQNQLWNFESPPTPPQNPFGSFSSSLF